MGEIFDRIRYLGGKAYVEIKLYDIDRNLDVHQIVIENAPKSIEGYKKLVREN